MLFHQIGDEIHIRAIEELINILLVIGINILFARDCCIVQIEFCTQFLVTDHAMLDYIRRYSTEIRQSGGASLSLDAPPPDFDSTEMTYAEVLIDEYALSPEQIFIKKETILIVRKALSMVSKREQEYLHYRYGFIDDIEHDRKETAYHFRLTVSRAKRLEKDALENCRRHLEGKI